MHSIAILGGTFDPIHNGHIKISLNIQNNFQFDSYIFLPCKIPTIKPPSQADTNQRLKMIQIALKNYPDFSLDLREIHRDSPSYMVETLTSFRIERPQASITLIIGKDAFLSLPLWHEWNKIISLANLLVISRWEFVDETTPKVLHQFLNKYEIQSKEKLINTKSGCVYLFDAGNYLISSSKIREEIKRGIDVTKKIPPQVYEYIKSQELYR